MPVAHLADRAVIRITGPDARGLLHNILTLDMDGVDRHGSGYGALLTPQGKILWDFILHKMPDGYAADARADQAEAFAKRLALYKLRAKVDIAAAPELAVFVEWTANEPGASSDPSPQGQGQSYITPLILRCGTDTVGTASKGAPESAGSTVSRASRPALRQAQDGHLSMREVGRPPYATAMPQGGGVAPADPRLAQLGSRWVAPADSVATDASAADWHRHRIALAVPEGGVDFIFGEAFPHDAGMDSLNGIAFDKGCYVGQEVVSRMRHRGTARRRIVALRGAGSLPEAGAEVTAGERPLGRLGSSADGNAIGLVRLDRLRAALDAGLPVKAGALELTAALPAWATYGWPAAGAAGED